MGQLINAKELKEQGSLVDFLSRLGYEPVKKYGKEYMYTSMLREGDKTPSLSVDDKIGVWYDHGIGRGGNIIDFGLAYWPDLTFNEVLEKIRSNCNIVQTPERMIRPRIPAKVRNYVVDDVLNIGHHPAITAYLKRRGVFESGKSCLYEVYYHVMDDKCISKPFFAAGWLNESGSWEVRNKYFKGCLGNKAITFIPGDKKRAVIFEGCINYLSWLSETADAKESIIILNTLSLLKEGVSKAKQFSSIDLYFDRDLSGFQASKDFIKALPYAIDRSSSFEGFNDYNDKLVHSLKRISNDDFFERKRSGYSR